jgi:hypothetical protein
MTMELMRDFKKTVVARVERDPAFAKALQTVNLQKVA